MKNSKNLELFKCQKCNDTGFIYNDIKKSYYQCNCIKERIIIEQLERTGLGERAINRSFADFKTWNPIIKEMKNIATGYYLSFDKLKDKKSNSLALLGESGAGKTHLLVALINNFVTNKKLKVVYMSYIDAITELKQNILNGEVYQKKVTKYKNAEILVIDDLFKNGHTDSDLRLVSEILNYRYINKLPVMISSEYLIRQLIEIDKAIGGRIKEMTQDYLYEVVGIENNYRMKFKNKD